MFCVDYRPREFLESVSHVRLLSWMLLGALQHTALLTHTHANAPLSSPCTYLIIYTLRSSFWWYFKHDKDSFGIKPHPWTVFLRVQFQRSEDLKLLWWKFQFLVWFEMHRERERKEKERNKVTTASRRERISPLSFPFLPRLTLDHYFQQFLHSHLIYWSHCTLSINRPISLQVLIGSWPPDSRRDPSPPGTFGQWGLVRCCIVNRRDLFWLELIFDWPIWVIF